MNFSGCGHVTLQNVELQNAGRHGLYLGGNQLTTARYSSTDNVTAHHNDGHGIWISNGQRVVSSKNIVAYSNGGRGLFLDASEHQVDGAYAFQNSGNGIQINKVFDVVYNNMKAHQNGLDGIHATTMADGIGANWQAFENGQLGTPGVSGYADVIFDDAVGTYGAGSLGVVIDGIRAGALYDTAHRWMTTGGPGGNAILVADYALYLADGLGNGGESAERPADDSLPAQGRGVELLVSQRLLPPTPGTEVTCLIHAAT